jgi:hypothetical protein
MRTEIIELLDNLQTCEPVSYKNLTVYPLINKEKSKVTYVSPEGLLKSSLIEITEIDKGGSVPELLLKNHSDYKVFFWDGIELVGAKQNRVLNVSILINKQAEVIIHVSCVEQSRWSYKSKNFMMSDYSMPNRMRMNKQRSVEFAMRAGIGARSDQRQVWDDVANYSMAANVESPTNAMNDVLGRFKSELDDYSENLKPIAGQTGMVVEVNGRIIGLEYLSKEKVFKELYDRMLKSYAADCIVNNSHYNKKIAGFEGNPKEYLNNLRDVQSEEFKAVGLGSDIRFTNRNINGSAIVYRKNLISLSVSSIV